MTQVDSTNGFSARGVWRSSRGSAFTLIELLTVIFIISLLIGLLIPSLNSARNAAKKASTKSIFKSLEVGLESFKNDNERDFRATNGYAPSFAHPPIGGVFTPAMAVDGRMPFLADNPIITGAHWLPAMLIGVDTFGFVQRRAVAENLRQTPLKWYESTDGRPNVDRMPLYLDPGGVRLISIEQLPGRPNKALFPDWVTNNPEPDAMQRQPVIVDSFDQPILYYVANAFGTTANMLEQRRDLANDYDRGPPYYFHQDNEAFTGTGTDPGEEGWIFGDKPHTIALPGHEATAADVDTYPGGAQVGETFARFIHDRKARKAVAAGRPQSRLEDAPLKPANPDSYLLISAGVDGRFGTHDDVTNFPISEP